MDVRGQFGDIFGGLNALFTGLAFAGVIYTNLKAWRVELNAERGRVERELERTRTRDAELERLNADEAETRERVEAGYGSLDDATPEQHREIYEDIGLRVEVGLEKRPRISGFFLIGTMESDRNTAYVVTTPEPLVAGFVGKEETASRPPIPPRLSSEPAALPIPQTVQPGCKRRARCGLSSSV